MSETVTIVDNNGAKGYGDPNDDVDYGDNDDRDRAGELVKVGNYDGASLFIGAPPTPNLHSSRNINWLKSGENV